MSRLTDRLKRTFLPTLSPKLGRSDSEDIYPMPTVLQGAEPQPKPEGGLSNVLSGINTDRSRSSGDALSQRVQLDEITLDALIQQKIPHRIAARLPGSALTKLTITGVDDPEPITNALDELGWYAAFRKAATRGRHYGGAAIWMVCDGGGDVSEPLDFNTLQQVVRLVVIDRYELHREITQGSDIIDMDPYSDSYLTPTRYRYQPAAGSGLLEQPIIHSSRLIKFYGDPVPSSLLASYQYWGAPVMEGVLEAWKREDLAVQGGAEILFEIGGKTLTLGNLSDLMTSDQGRRSLTTYLTLQQRAFSILRMWIAGPGQTITPHSVSLAGWSDVYDRLAQNLAALADMPVVEMWGQAPGGLSTDDASARKQWAARCRDFQTLTLTPAINQLLEAVMCSSLGPTDGIEPDRWMVSWASYEVESGVEKATLFKTLAETLAIAVSMSAISPDEARAALREAGLSLPDDELEEVASSAAGTAPAALLDLLKPKAAPAPALEDEPADAPEDQPTQPADDEPTPPAETAMNGAQVASMLEVLTMVNSGLLTYEQGVGALGLAFQLDATKAAAILGPKGSSPQPATPPADPGAPAAPEPAP